MSVDTRGKWPLPSLGTAAEDGGAGGDPDEDAAKAIRRDGKAIALEGFANEYTVVLPDDPDERNAKVVLENSVTGERTTIKLRAKKNDTLLQGTLQFDDQDIDIVFDRNRDAVVLDAITLQEDIALVLAPQTAGERLVAFSGGGWNSHSIAAGLIAGALEKSQKNLAQLFAQTHALSANSGGSWFLSQLAYSSTFRDSLENESARQTYTTTGYNALVRAAFSALDSELSDIARTILATIGASEELQRDIPYLIGVTGNALAVNRLNQASFLEQFVYGYDGFSSLQSISLDAPRLTWAADKTISFATAITALPTVIHNQGGLSQNKLFTAAQASPTDAAQRNSDEPLSVLPLLLTSEAHANGSPRASAEFPFGDVALTFSSNALALTRPEPIHRKITQELQPQLSVVDATIASSSGAALFAAPSLYGTSTFTAPVRNATASLARELAPLASLQNNQLSLPKEQTAITANTELKDIARQSLTRLADGALVDNTSVAYGLRQLQKSKGIASDFSITVFMNSDADPITRLPIGNNRKSSYTINEDIAKLFGFDASGKQAIDGLIRFEKYPSLTPWVPSPAVFSPEAWRGVERPLWSYQQDGGSYRIDHFKLAVETVDNTLLGIRAGQKGVLNIFQSTNNQSNLFPVSPKTFDEYDQNVIFGRQAMAEGGWALLADSLGIDASAS